MNLAHQIELVTSPSGQAMLAAWRKQTDARRDRNAAEDRIHDLKVEISEAEEDGNDHLRVCRLFSALDTQKAIAQSAIARYEADDADPCAPGMPTSWTLRDGERNPFGWVDGPELHAPAHAGGRWHGTITPYDGETMAPMIMIRVRVDSAKLRAGIDRLDADTWTFADANGVVLLVRADREHHANDARRTRVALADALGVDVEHESLDPAYVAKLDDESLEDALRVTGKAVAIDSLRPRDMIDDARTRIAPRTLHWLVEGLALAPGKTSALHGQPQCGKSPFAMALATCVANGVDFLGMPTRRARVGYLDKEGGSLTQEYADRIAAGLGVEPIEVTTLEHCPTEVLVSQIDRTIVLRGLGMLVLDSYSAANRDIDTNSSRFATLAYALGDVANRTDCLILLIAHDRKGATRDRSLAAISGTGSLRGAIQTGVQLYQPTIDRFLVGVHNSRPAASVGFDPMRVRFDGNRPGPLTVSLDGQAGEQVVNVRALVLGALASGPKAGVRLETLAPRSAVRDAINTLRQEGKIERRERSWCLV